MVTGADICDELFYVLNPVWQFMIQLVDLVRDFDHHRVINGLDLHVEKGQRLAIIGPSGCGKSTLLRLIIGLWRPTAGHVRVQGRDVAMLSHRDLFTMRLKIAMVFQSSALFDSLTVGENVGFGLREHTHYSEQKIRQIVQEKLELVGLPKAASLMPSELSGGMQKRVSLARAIATNPEIILYDEPTTGLDPITMSTIEDLINTLNDEFHVTSLIVTHQMNTVYRCCQRVAIMEDGKLIECGSPEQTRRSQNPLVKNFIEGNRPSLIQ